MKLHGLCGVYMIECLPTGQVYIGQSENWGRRIDSHIQKLRLRSTDVSPAYQLAFDTYGIDAFYAQLVEACSVEELPIKEREWMCRFRIEDLLNTQKLNLHPDFKRKYPGVRLIDGRYYAYYAGQYIGTADTELETYRLYLRTKTAKNRKRSQAHD